MNGNDINKIIKNLNDYELNKLYWNKSNDKRFKFLSSGNQGSVYKLGNYVVKITNKKDFSQNEFNAIKLITEHLEFNNFVKYYCITQTQNYVIYVMNYINYDLRKWFEVNHSDHEWLLMLFQILVSLYQMHNILKIYHNDLQIKNIICSKNDKEQKLVYNINNKKYEIKTKYIFYIADLGSVSSENIKAAYVSDDDLLQTFLKKLITIELLKKYKTKEEILKQINQTNAFKEYIKIKKDKLDARVKRKQMNQEIADELLKKEIIYYSIDNNLIDISEIKNNIKIPSQKIIKLFDYFKEHDVIENIEIVYSHISVPLLEESL